MVQFQTLCKRYVGLSRVSISVTNYSVKTGGKSGHFLPKSLVLTMQWLLRSDLAPLVRGVSNGLCGIFSVILGQVSLFPDTFNISFPPSTPTSYYPSLSLYKVPYYYCPKEEHLKVPINM